MWRTIWRASDLDAPKPHFVGDVIQPRFEHLQQGFAGDAFFLLRMVISVAELALEQPVDTAQLLFFAQLHAVA